MKRTTSHRQIEDDEIGGPPASPLLARAVMLACIFASIFSSMVLPMRAEANMVVTLRSSEVALPPPARRAFPGLGSVVSYNVSPVRQPTPMSCWAAVYTMMRSWREQRMLTIPEAIATLGSPYLLYLSEDNGLPGGAEQDLVEKAGLRAIPPASYPLKTFRLLLRERGPLWITAGDGITAHARLLVGIYSPDENESAEAYKKSWMEFVDPEDGTFHYETAFDFEDLFEREAASLVGGHMDRTPLRWQIITF
ncbi:papain-like cysteine protease family protein [Mesorhizobium sp. WSM1293]|uniref:papain-like cysteine protease family protein n=1 Tax=Mesorhizobium sp. WSM1293 TaxID=1040984 RepID=UPI000A07929B|nr:papain-like cysteine protease family protein [Mesorhizobium sp. WSM1293]